MKDTGLKEKVKISGKQDTTKTNNLENTETSRTSFAIGHVIGQPFMCAGVLKAFYTGLQLTYPFFIKETLKFVAVVQGGNINFESDSISVRYRGYWLSALLFTTMSCKI